MFVFKRKRKGWRCSGRLSVRKRPEHRTGPLPSSRCENDAGSLHIRLTVTAKAVALKVPNCSAGGMSHLLASLLLSFWWLAALFLDPSSVLTVIPFSLVVKEN